MRKKTVDLTAYVRASGHRMEPLVNGYRQLSAVSNIPERTLRTFVKNGVIPYIKTGHRTILFAPSKVERALAKREVKEVA